MAGIEAAIAYNTHPHEGYQLRFSQTVVPDPPPSLNSLQNNYLTISIQATVSIIVSIPFIQLFFCRNWNIRPIGLLNGS